LDAGLLKSILSTLVLPPASPLLLAAGGLWWARRNRRWGLALAGVGVALTWLLATPAVSLALLGLLEGDSRPLTPERLATARAADDPPQAVVVLGGGASHDGREWPHTDRVNARSLQRGLHGARMARMTGLPVLVSGGRPRHLDVSEAELLRRVLEGDLGVRVDWLEEGSRDTADNARESAAILRAAGIRSVVLVTHAYHMRRAQAAFEAAGMVVLPAPHQFQGSPLSYDFGDWVPGAHAMEVSRLALHEVLGYWWYRLRRLA